MSNGQDEAKECRKSRLEGQQRVSQKDDKDDLPHALNGRPWSIPPRATEPHMSQFEVDRGGYDAEEGAEDKNKVAEGTKMSVTKLTLVGLGDHEQARKGDELEAAVQAAHADVLTKVEFGDGQRGR